MSPAATPLRFEVLPFASGEQEAEQARHPLTLTVTCSPRHGVDHTVDVACRLRALGHAAIVHVAARMVRGPEHLDGVLDRLADARIADVFLVGGDATKPEGPYASALELLPVLRAHRQAPSTIGIGAYPEGHPLIDDATLADALREKGASATYMTTQLCFHPDALLGWLERTRAAGIDLPVYVGIPGAVDARRLLEISMRVGVGASIRYARKQQRVTRLFGARMHAAGRLHATLAPLLGDGALGIAGLHYFTFNRLLDTVSWAEAQAAREGGAPLSVGQGNTC
jgi:methylenetetrahydrofolate reductase (NADPH)